jgi:predicted transcriptional regulator
MKMIGQPTFREQILTALTGHTVSTEELRLRFNAKSVQIAQAIRELHRAGLIERVAFGEYRAVTKPMPHVSAVQLAGDGPAATTWRNLQRSSHSETE